MALPQWPRQFIAFCLVPLAQAYTVFNTNCSAPTTRSNFVSSPNTRGTLDILWNSLFTIFACTWTLQHPNVPEQRDFFGPTKRGWVQWVLKGFCRSMLRMIVAIVAILAPELLIAAACFDLYESIDDHQRMQYYAQQDRVSWSLRHTFYANMGAFVVKSTPSSTNAYHNPYYLNCKGIHLLRRQRKIEKLPDITEDQIKDMDKGDALATVIAVGQILWSVIQIIVRATRRLSVSPLEVAVVAFSACAVLIYGLYWKKPQSIGATYTILKYDGAIPSDMLGELERAQNIKRQILPEMLLIGHHTRQLGAPLSLDSNRNDEDDKDILVMVLGAALFGGIHVAAWNFTFPSNIESILWRYTSIYTTAAPLCKWCCKWLWFLIFPPRPKPNELVKFPTLFMFFIGLLIKIIHHIIVFLYIPARLFIIVEMFRTLCFLPPDSFVSTWASNIPHVA